MEGQFLLYDPADRPLASSAVKVHEGPKLAELFSRPVFRALAHDAPLPPETAQLLQDATLRYGLHHRPLADLFEIAFETMKSHYRAEYYFKSQLVSKIVLGRHSPRTAAALLEVPSGKAIADVVIVNGTSTSYEVKSDLDNFDRVGNQIAQYGTRYEFTNVVTTDGRRDLALRSLPRWVGVVILRPNGSLSTARDAISRLSHLDPSHQFSLLRLGEARNAIEQETGKRIDAPTGLAHALLRNEFLHLTPAKSNEVVTRALRARGRSAIELLSMPGFPRALGAMAYAQPLSRAGQFRLMSRLNTPLEVLA